MWFSSYLYEKGVITGDEFATAVCEQLSRRPMLGHLAVQRGKLSIKQVRKIFSEQAFDLEKPFGEVAVDLGFLNEEDIALLLVQQERSVPSLGELLVEQGILTQKQMLSELTLAHQSFTVPVATNSTATVAP